MRACSMSLTGGLSLKEEDDEVCVCVGAPSCDSLILSLSALNGAASGTALYYLSGPCQ